MSVCSPTGSRSSWVSCGCATTWRCSRSGAPARRRCSCAARSTTRAESLLELTLSGGSAAPGEARHALAAALAGRLSPRLEGDALVVVSELVTNAIRHGGARGPTDEIGVHAAMRDTVLRLEVTDPGPGFEPGGHGPRPDGGYGLHLLDRLAIQWGVTGADPVTVWAELEG